MAAKKAKVNNKNKVKHSLGSKIFDVLNCFFRGYCDYYDFPILEHYCHIAYW